MPSGRRRGRGNAGGRGTRPTLTTPAHPICHRDGAAATRLTSPAGIPPSPLGGPPHPHAVSAGGTVACCRSVAAVRCRPYFRVVNRLSAVDGAASVRLYPLLEP